jgi:hypothetical protein
MLENLDDEVGRQLRQQGHLALQAHGCGGSSGSGEESTKL